MRDIGFSSFVLDPNPYLARDKTAILGCDTIEFSALREHELKDVFDVSRVSGLPWFNSFSVHLPKKLEIIEEESLIELCKDIIDRFPKINFVLHPNVIQDVSLWRPIQTNLSIENLDTLAPLWTSVFHLKEIFSLLPRSDLCFDIGHALQVSRHEAWDCKTAQFILKDYLYRISQIHISSVDNAGKHHRINSQDAEIMKDLLRRSPEVPVIIESPVKDLDEAREELELVKEIFDV